MTRDIMAIRDDVFTVVELCRKQLAHGMVDLSLVEQVVKEYCQAISTLPTEKGREHIADLQALSQQMNVLETSLKEARNEVSLKLKELNAIKKADVAYKKTDGIGIKHFMTDEGDNS